MQHAQQVVRVDQLAAHEPVVEIVAVAEVVRGQVECDLVEAVAEALAVERLEAIDERGVDAHDVRRALRCEVLELGALLIGAAPLHINFGAALADLR